jgi:hypothetical protein
MTPPRNRRRSRSFTTRNVTHFRPEQLAASDSQYLFVLDAADDAGLMPVLFRNTEKLYPS